jgi:hypothetical protein
MRSIISAVAVLAICTGGAAAQPRHDLSLEKAAAAIVAQKMGEIRGSFDFDATPEFVRPVDWRPGVWRAGSEPRPVASLIVPAPR